MSVKIQELKRSVTCNQIILHEKKNVQQQSANKLKKVTNNTSFLMYIFQKIIFNFKF